MGALAGCASTRPAPVADARAAIMATSREFSSLCERGDAAAMVALYTPRVLEHRATPDSIVVAGPVAYDWGTYRVRTRNAAGEERETLGKYVIVWREVSPGEWRMHLDMWNSGPPAN